MTLYGPESRCQNPAHAGMNPTDADKNLLPMPKPRSRGDEPSVSASSSTPTIKTPLTRG